MRPICASSTLAAFLKSELRDTGHLSPERSAVDLTLSRLRAYAACHGILEAATPAAVMASDPNSSTKLKVLSAFVHRVTAILVDAGYLAGTTWQAL